MKPQHLDTINIKINFEILETQQTSKSNINSLNINVNDIILAHDETVHRHFRRIAILAGLLPSRDFEIRGAIVRITKINTILKRRVNKLFPIENAYKHTN